MDTRTLSLVDASASAVTKPRLRVGVLVDLPLDASAGGHVRCWERLAEAGSHFADRVHLTVHFMGRQAESRTMSENVRYCIEPSVFSTRRLPFLSHVPDHTDLAPWHAGLARRLPDYDVIHTTDAYFAYAKTAMIVGRRLGIPIVNSIHTNTPEYARLFTAQTIERLVGENALGRFLLSGLKIPERTERRMKRQLAAYQRRCAFALVSRPEQLEATRAMLGGRAGLLRRGIDRRAFHPDRRNRAWLEADYGIPADRLVVMATGRLNRGKNIQLLVDAVAALLDQGVDVQLLCAGDGDERRPILDRLGARATCPGVVEPKELARLYASADLFALPSMIEESANVVLEAFASGLPALVAGNSGMGRAVRHGETGLVLPGDDPAPWVQAMKALLDDQPRRVGMGRAARHYAEVTVPSWIDVFAEDLLPHWEMAARAAQPLPLAAE